MNAVADGLRIEPIEFKSVGQANVLKPVYGSLKSMNVKIETIKEFNQAKSDASKKEVYDEVEVATFYTDKFSRISIPTSKLSREYLRDLSYLINAHREQKDTDDLKIADWQAIGGQEKHFILDMQIYTVKQLAQFPEFEAHRLGPDGKRFIELAKRHEATLLAEKKEKEESSEAVKILRAEKEELMKRLAALEAKVGQEDSLEKEVKKAKAKKAEETA